VKSVLAATANLREANGNLSAARVTKLFGVSASQLTGWLRRTKQAVSKTPDADSHPGCAGVLRVRPAVEAADQERHGVSQVAANVARVTGQSPATGIAGEGQVTGAGGLGRGYSGLGSWMKDANFFAAWFALYSLSEVNNACRVKTVEPMRMSQVHPVLPSSSGKPMPFAPTPYELPGAGWNAPIERHRPPLTGRSKDGFTTAASADPSPSPIHGSDSGHQNPRLGPEARRL
jgi:hypothetical protein